MKTDIEHFLKSLNRSPRTISTYRHSLSQFVKTVGEDAELNTETYIKFLISLQHKSSSTQRVHRTAVLKFYAFCKAGNMGELQEASISYTRRSGNKVVKFNKLSVEKIISYCESLNGDLEALRDRAFVLTLVDTGLRISEACSMKRGDIDWERKCAIFLGKGNTEDKIWLSNRSIRALQEYLSARSSIKWNSKDPTDLEPLFARHDLRASRKIRPITAGGMWKAIKERIVGAGMQRGDVKISDFRHYFITKVFRAKRDLKLSQKLARHKSILTTSRYTYTGDEMSAEYDEIFNKH